MKKEKSINEIEMKIGCEEDISFSEFKLKVQNFCLPEDFKKNNDKLECIRASSYDTFIRILFLGGEIVNSIKVCEEIFKLSVQTHHTEIEIVELSTKFRLINALIDGRSCENSCTQK